MHNQISRNINVKEGGLYSGYNSHRPVSVVTGLFVVSLDYLWFGYLSRCEGLGGVFSICQ